MRGRRDVEIQHHDQRKRSVGSEASQVQMGVGQASDVHWKSDCETCIYPDLCSNVQCGIQTMVKDEWWTQDYSLAREGAFDAPLRD